MSFSRVVLVLYLIAGQACAWAEDALPLPLVQALRSAAIPASAASFFVQEVGAGRGWTEASPLLSINAQQPMNPASTMKLVTTYAALELLGPAFTWKTIAASNAPLKNEVLEGDLILKGGGDPQLVVEDVWLMLRQLRAQGVREIRGDLVLDHSLFESAAYDSAAFDGEPLKPYNVAPDALLVNFKAITLSFIPDGDRRQVRVSAEPQLAGVEYGALRLVDGPCGDWRSRIAADFSNVEHIRFNGSYPASCGEQTWSVSVLDHNDYTGRLFRQLWTDLGGNLRGWVRDGLMPSDARVLATRESPALAEVVRSINKHSNNVMARQLYLDLAAEVLKLPANTERAERVVKSFLGNRSLNMPELVIENGSGLSRNERISAQSMGRMLLAAWAAPVMPELMSSLPLVGYDGTMRRRLRTNDVSGQAHIKTGSLEGVRAIAGYVLSVSGRRYVVVCFINHVNASAGQAVQDALLKWVFEDGNRACPGGCR